ncbi:putative inactive receptor kinase [Zea mays]|uniref:Putative inactive receptor kinase n=1 Tax=Zea mays TaxID=4577 RepID=A0A3L6DT18_MAIZE|nr:putative inactive receptor kinase [Zea mays]
MPPPRPAPHITARPPTGRLRRGNLARPRDLLVLAPSHAHPPLARIWRRATRHARPPHGAAAAQPALQQPVGPAPRRPPAPARARGPPPPPQRLLRRAPARARGLAALQALDLSSNGFGGGIPDALANLTRLAALDLSNNSLSGRVPDLGLLALQFLNLSNNRLDGPVPPSLLRFADAAFAGNDLTRPPAAAPPTAAVARRRRGGPRRRRRHGRGRRRHGCREGREKKGRESPESKVVIGKAGEGNRMVFLDGPALAFDLEDLLRASAEVLGKGAFGTAYRAMLEDATTVVVKRLSKEVSTGRRDFEQQMELVGRIRHRNVVELRSYYYSKDEKLLVYDCYTSGSVSNMLHALITSVPS